jgi:uncharacterized membrane protein YphA (DoxX/SURF4 family)
MESKLVFFNWIDYLRGKKFFRIVYRLTGISMAVTFILSGIRKFPGLKFTILGTDNPVGLYFEAMHQLGFYWNFIGYFQVICGILLLFKRTAPLAVLLMLPVTVNILLVSVGLDMRGTPLITSAMLLANIFMLLWHYERYLPVVNTPVK